LIASTSFTASALLVIYNPASVPSLMDVGIGASGSEVVLVPNLHAVPPASVTNLPVAIYVPISIPAASRLSVRIQASSASVAGTCTAYIIGGAFDLPAARSLVTAYGAVTTNSRGTPIDPGATANTKGAWAQLTASTTAVTRGLLLCCGNQGNTSATVASWVVDVGVGASGSEVVLIPNYRLVQSTGNTLAPGYSPVFPVSIPSGSRLAVRAQCSIATSPARLFDFVLYGIT
jgi:hypothetical protein